MNIERRERLPISGSSAVFIEDNKGRLLLVQQASERKGFRWGPPAGGIEAHEDPLMAAKREVIEEIGVEPELVDLIGIYTVDRGNTSSGIGFVFRGKLPVGQSMLLKDGEITDARYFTSDEINELISQDKLYKPEYNLSGIEDWTKGQHFPMEAIKPLSKTN